MRISLVLILFLFSSCQWLNERAIKNWTSDTIDLMVEMSSRKSMIHDTPLKTMEALEAPDGIDLSQKELCRCAAMLYGGILTVIANEVKESSIKHMCKGMGQCFYQSKVPDFFKSTCFSYVEKGPFKTMARDRRKIIPTFTKARRKLSSHCSKL